MTYHQICQETSDEIHTIGYRYGKVELWVVTIFWAVYSTPFILAGILLQPMHELLYNRRREKENPRSQVHLNVRS